MALPVALFGGDSPVARRQPSHPRLRGFERLINDMEVGKVWP
jgi:hypothetical protein